MGIPPIRNRGFCPSAKVRHKTFGEGVIRSVKPKPPHDHLITISFEDGRSRKFAASVAVERNLLQILEAPELVKETELLHFPAQVSIQNDPEFALRVADEILNSPPFLRNDHILKEDGLREMRRIVREGVKKLRKGGKAKLEELQVYLFKAIYPPGLQGGALEVLCHPGNARKKQDLWKLFLNSLKSFRERRELAISEKKRKEVGQQIWNDPVFKELLSAGRRVAREFTQDQIGTFVHRVLKQNDPKLFFYNPKNNSRMVAEFIRNIEKTWGKEYLPASVSPEIKGEEVDRLEERKGVAVFLYILGKRRYRKLFLDRTLVVKVRSGLESFQKYRMFCKGARTLEIAKELEAKLGKEGIHPFPISKGAGFDIPYASDAT